MASVTYRCHRKLANGSYEVVHSETESGVVVRPNTETVEQTLKKTLRMKNAEDVVPGFHAKIDADTLQGKTLDEVIGSVFGDGDDVLPVSKGGTGVSSIDELAKILNLPTGYAEKPDRIPSVGNTFDWLDITWRVVHVTDYSVWCCAENIIDKTAFGSTAFFEGSVLYQHCLEFANKLNIVNAPYLINVYGLPTFPPTIPMILGDMSYFNAAAHRISKYNNVESSYWTSSPWTGSNTNYVSTGIVNTTGGITSNTAAYTCGFRPAIVFDRSAINYEPQLSNGILTIDTLDLGSDFLIGNRSYVIVHVTDDTVYISSKYAYGSTTIFGSNNTYSGSDLASECVKWYENEIPTEFKNSGIFQNVTVMDVTYPCFVATLEQLTTDFSWYAAASANRIYCSSESGSAVTYWTSTSYNTNGVWYVNTDGETGHVNKTWYQHGPTTDDGFRPTLALKKSMIKTVH